MRTYPNCAMELLLYPREPPKHLAYLFSDPVPLQIPVADAHVLVAAAASGEKPSRAAEGQSARGYRPGGRWWQPVYVVPQPTSSWCHLRCSAKARRLRRSGDVLVFLHRATLRASSSMDGGHRDLGLVIHDVVEWAYGVRTPRISGIRGRLPAAHGAQFNTETLGGVRRREYGFHEICFCREYRRSAERTSLIGCEPGVDASSMEGVAADRQQSKLIGRLKLGETNGAIAGGGRTTALDCAKSEERQRIDQRQILRRYASTVEAAVRLYRWRDDVVRVQPLAAAAAEVAKEEIESHGDEKGRGEDENDRNNACSAESSPGRRRGGITFIRHHTRQPGRRRRQDVCHFCRKVINLLGRHEAEKRETAKVAMTDKKR